MNLFQELLIFYAIIMAFGLYLVSGRGIPLERVRAKFSPLKRRMKRRIRDRKASKLAYRIVLPFRPRSFSEILLVVIIYLFIGYLILTKIFFFTAIVSGSMRPAFDKGDLVLIQTLSTEPEKGDIIMFPGSVDRGIMQQSVIHRVHHLTEKGIKTKGDAMPRVDPWVVPRDKIQGKAVTLFGHPIVIENAGETLVLEPGKKITNPLVINYILGKAKQMGLAIFMGVMVLYFLLELKDRKTRRPFP